MYFSVFMSGGHPHQPAWFPPFRHIPYAPSAHTLPFHTNHTTAHTAVGEVEVFGVIKPTMQRPTPPWVKSEFFGNQNLGEMIDGKTKSFVYTF
ncbi:MAG: hypothetical protein ACI8V2_000122 [Candidatus Latescibacterota bacterium]|jgi:hypothetical protein